MEKIIALHRLKEGVTIEEYRKFSLQTDQPTTSNQPGIQRFEVYEVKASGEGPLHFDVMEIIEVDSWEAWEQVTKSAAMKKVMDDWPLYGDDTSILIVRADKIE